MKPPKIVETAERVEYFHDMITAAFSTPAIVGQMSVAERAILMSYLDYSRWLLGRGGAAEDMLASLEQLLALYRLDTPDFRKIRLAKETVQ